MTKITPEIQEYIIENEQRSNRLLSDLVEGCFAVKVSHVAIGNFKTKYRKEKLTIKEPEKVVIKTPKPKTRARILSFSDFMKKLEKSDSYSAKLLKEKLNVKGRSRQINRDRILRVIQYAIDVVQEQ